MEEEDGSQERPGGAVYNREECEPARAVPEIVGTDRACAVAERAPAVAIPKVIDIGDAQYIARHLCKDR